MRTTTANSAENDDDEFLYDDDDDDDVQVGGTNYFDANNAPLLFPQKSTDFRKWWSHRHRPNTSASAAVKGDGRVLLLGGVESPSAGHFFLKCLTHFSLCFDTLCVSLTFVLSPLI